VQNGLLVNFRGQLLEAAAVIDSRKRVANGSEVDPPAELFQIVSDTHGFQSRADIFRPRQELLVQAVLFSLELHRQKSKAAVLIVQRNQMIGRGRFRILQNFHQFPQVDDLIIGTAVHLPEQKKCVRIPCGAVCAAIGADDAVPVFADTEVEHLDAANQV